MIEKEFVDRVPLNPGRIKLVPVDGQENTFDMERADNPTVPGTSMNKAAFDSIIQSRLTGRYYVPTVEQVNGADLMLTANPIPTSGWGNVTTTGAKSGDYEIITVSSLDANRYPDKAVDGDNSTCWRSISTNNPFFLIKFPTPIKVTKFLIKAHINVERIATLRIRGSNDGVNWTSLLLIEDLQTDEVERVLTTTGKYTHYRIDAAGTWDLSVYTFKVAEYEFTELINNYSISSGFPLLFTEEQRITIRTPDTVTTLGVTKNNLNGIPIKTILQGGKRYELRYTGTSFVAKEV